MRRYPAILLMGIFITGLLCPVAFSGETKAFNANETLESLKKEMDGLGKQIVLKKREGADVKEIKALSQIYEAKKRLIGELESASADSSKNTGVAAKISEQEKRSAIAGTADKEMINLPCAYCKNTGRLNNNECGVCEGDGWVIGLRSNSTKCQKCNGSGMTGSDKCKWCQGSGWFGTWPGLKVFSGTLLENKVEVACAYCRGTGIADGRKCLICGGDGKASTPVSNPEKCKWCNGTGVYSFRPCRACNGIGVAHSVMDNIPKDQDKPVWADGRTIMCKYCGTTGYYGGAICEWCEGDGYLWMNSQQMARCPACRGTGINPSTREKCQGCRGYGILNTYAGVKNLYFDPTSGFNSVCPQCKGSGCRVCGWDGYLWTPVRDPIVCGMCQGKGTTPLGPCEGCGGLGLANARKSPTNM